MSVDLDGALLVLLEQVSVLVSLMLGVRNVLLETALKLFVELLDFADKLLFHALKVFHVFIFGFLTSAVIGLFHLEELVLLLFFDCLNHVLKLLSLLIVTVSDLSLLCVKLCFDDTNITLKLLFESIQSRVVEVYELIHVDKMVSKSHLVLLFGLIKISIKHLENSILSINLSIMVLLINLNFFLQLLSLSQSQQLSPMRENFHPVEVCHLLLFHHSSLQLVLSHLHDLG